MPWPFPQANLKDNFIEHIWQEKNMAEGLVTDRNRWVSKHVNKASESLEIEKFVCLYMDAKQ